MLAVLSGGNWNNAANAGIWTGNLNNYRSNSNNNVGFRCACVPQGSSRLREASEVDSQGCTVLRHANYQCERLSRNRRGAGERQAIGLFMRRKGHLFEQAFTGANLFMAHLDARKGKRNKPRVFDFETNLGGNLNQLYREIHGGTYRPHPYYRFEVYEPKRRVIFAPAYRDTVVQHAIYRVINPIFDRSFITTSFACRKGYGTHKAAEYVHQTIRAVDPESYYLQLDVRKFFYRIDREILRSLVERKIKDARLIDLMMMFAEHEEPLGIPIGNLLSQLFALIYLNPLDHFVKRALKACYYARYVDDFLLIGHSRSECIEYRESITEFLAQELRLELSKATIQKVSRGVNFCGYRMWPSRRLIRRHSLTKFRRAVRADKPKSAISLLGHAKRTQSLQHMLGYIQSTNDALYQTLPKSYRRLHHVPAP